MPKIKVLPKNEACKIAAGEVVERPANVVKELVENALDAGSTLIEVYLEKSGKKLIRVVDNGCGMSASDAKLCFEHHATSKITTVDDLEKINSFGFRGEALSSISSVSKVVLVTKEKEALSGVQTTLEDGKVVSQIDIASSQGTDISIKDLFYNVPARQKFLKKDETEFRQINQIIQAFVFAYTDVHFKFFSDNRLVYNCPPATDLQTRVTQVWDKTISENLLTIAKDSENSLKVSGVITNHQVARYNRNNIFCFVNKRLVKNYSLVKSLLKGYSNVLPAGRYSAAVLFIDLPGDQVDVNVHPRKEEVTFLNPRKVDNALFKAAKSALEDNLSDIISTPQNFNVSVNSLGFGGPKKFKAARSSDFDFDSFSEPFGFAADNDAKHVEPLSKPVSLNFDDLKNNSVVEKHLEPEQQSFVDRNYEIIGQFNQTYILVSKSDGLVIVDQHAAHERVMYETFKKRFAEVATVNLMFPATITLSEKDLNVLKPHMSLLNEHGITAEIFSVDQIVIQAIPTYLKNIKFDDLINQLVAWINEYQKLDIEQFKKEINEKMHAQMACKAAVKAGDILSFEQMQELIDDLEKSDNKLTCPHGRPTVWNFTINEIEKKFKRKL